VIVGEGSIGRELRNSEGIDETVEQKDSLSE